MDMKPTILILMLILMPLISAVQVGNVGTEGVNFAKPTPPVNYSLQNVNNSLFLQGYVPNDFWQVANNQNELTGNKNGSFNIATTGLMNSTGFVIGSNVLSASEFSFLDGQNQQLRTNSSPTFTGFTILNTTYINSVATNALKIEQFAVKPSIFVVDTVNGWVSVGGTPANTGFTVKGTHVANYGLMQLTGHASGTDAFLTLDSGLQQLAGFYFKEDEVIKWYLYNDGTDNNKFKLNGTSGVVLTAINTGRIGIGTTNPTTTLDVRGKGNFSGTIYINNITDVSTLGNASWNQSYANNLYAKYNFTNNNFNGSGNFNTTGNISATYFKGDGSLLTGISSGGDNASWNESLANNLYAKYNFTNNNFNGSGNFTTDGNIVIGLSSPNSLLSTKKLTVFSHENGVDEGLARFAVGNTTTGGIYQYTTVNQANKYVIIGGVRSGQANDVVLSLNPSGGGVVIGGVSGLSNNPLNVYRDGGVSSDSYLANFARTSASTNAALIIEYNANGTASTGVSFRQGGGLQGTFSFGVYNKLQQFFMNENGLIGVGTTSPQYPLHVAGNTSIVNGSISIFAEKNISATGFITRTSVFDKSKGSALDLIKDSDAYKNPDGTINHKAFYGYVGGIKDIDYSRPVIKEECKEINQTAKLCNNITVYPYTKIVEGVELGAEIDLLRQGIWELNQIIKEQNNTINNLKIENERIKKCLTDSIDFLGYKKCVNP